MPAGNPGVPLSTIRPGSKVNVSRVHDFDSSFLQYISKIGIELNKEISVEDVFDFDHSLLISIDKKEMNISSKIAANIFVTITK